RGALFGIYLPYSPTGPQAPPEYAMPSAEREQYERALEALARRAPIVLVDPELAEKSVGCCAKQGRLLYIDGAARQIQVCPKFPVGPRALRVDGPGALRRAARAPILQALHRETDEARRCPRDPIGELEGLVQIRFVDSAHRAAAGSYADRWQAALREDPSVAR